MDEKEAAQVLRLYADNAEMELLACNSTRRTYILDKYLNALNMAINDIESRAGCEYCNGNLTIGRIIHDMRGTVSVAIHRGRNELLIYDDDLIGSVDINYCPICGRKISWWKE